MPHVHDRPVAVTRARTFRSRRAALRRAACKRRMHALRRALLLPRVRANMAAPARAAATAAASKPLLRGVVCDMDGAPRGGAALSAAQRRCSRGAT